MARFGRDVAAALDGVLGAELVGVWFVGSIALSGYVPGESDVDIVAACADVIGDRAKDAIVHDLLEVTDRCPARGLELSVYRRAVAAAASSRDAAFEVNVNGGPRMARSVHRDHREEPGFWYVLDRAIAHRFGVTIVGPPASDVFADAPRATLLDAMIESMRWHRQHERATLYSVLNASRAWRFATEDVLGSKLEGATWARERWHRPDVIDAAVDLRHGRGGALDEPAVDELLDHVEQVLLDSR